MWLETRVLTQALELENQSSVPQTSVYPLIQTNQFDLT
jgi:hypothetical protein